MNGVMHEVEEGWTVAAALWNLGIWGVRRSVTGEMRGPVCGMGVCFECRAEVDGERHVRTCMVSCREGMGVRTDE